MLPWRFLRVLISHFRRCQTTKRFFHRETPLKYESYRKPLVPRPLNRPPRLERDGRRSHRALVDHDLLLLKKITFDWYKTNAQLIQFFIILYYITSVNGP